MTTRHAVSLLEKLLTEDIELAQTLATAEPPSSQQRLLTVSLKAALERDRPPEEIVRLLSIAQAILAGSYHFLTENSALRLFEELAAFAVSNETAEIRERGLTCAALLFNRVRSLHSDLSDEPIALLRAALQKAPSPPEASILSAICARVDSAIRRSHEARSLRPRKFAVPDLDIPKAASNVHEDAEGDWYQDPWGWPEVEWLGNREAERVAARLRDDRCDWVVPIDVSKQGNGVRPAIVLNPLDRLAYQSLVDELSLESAGNLPSWVYGWRLGRTRSAKGHYASNKDEWQAFSRRVVDLCKRMRFTAHLDIQSFFPTVDTSRLIAQLGRRYRKAAVLDRLETYFEAWHKCQNGLGIPQRSLASSVLAHAVLRPLDLFLDRMSEQGASGTFVATRWMDDIWLHCDDEKKLRTCVAEIENVLGQLRLSLNAEKSKVFLSKDAGEAVQLVEVSGAVGQLEAQVTPEELLRGAEDAPRFKIRLAIAKMVGSGNFSFLNQLNPDALFKLTHVADRLAVALRVSGQWRRFTDTYLEFARRHVSQESWSVAAWAEMFPNDADGEVSKVQEFFSERIVSDLQRLLTPLAAQRLTAWSHRFGFGRLNEVDAFADVDGREDAFRMRGISFAALRTNISREAVRLAVDKTGDELTSSYLRYVAFNAPPLSRRFSSK